MSHYSSELPYDRVPALRRGAYTFMRRHAATAWAFQHGPDGWNVFMPPEVQELPAPKRFRTHARQEAQRLADARLFALCPRSSADAVEMGAQYRQTVADLHGSDDFIDTFGIQPPARHGFVWWQDPNGVGYGGNGAPILACHWGPYRGGGSWLAWWSDNYAVTKGYKAEAHAAGGTWPSAISVGWITTVGALFYDDQMIIRPCRPGISEPCKNDGSADETDQESARIALVYTTLATWQLLNGNRATRLTEHAPTPAQDAADLVAGLRPRPVTQAVTLRSVSSAACQNTADTKAQRKAGRD